MERPVACWQEETSCSIIKMMIHRLLHLVEGCDTVMNVHSMVKKKKVRPELKSDDTLQPAIFTGNIISM